MKSRFVFCFFCLSVIQVYAQPRINVLIEGGSRFTNKVTLEVELFIENIHQIKLGLTKEQIAAETPKSVMLSQSERFEGAKWTSFKQQFKFRIKSVDGQQTVYAKVLFEDGNSQMGQAAITLDQSPPKLPGVKIFATGDTKTKLLVNLKLGASEAAYMKISNTSSFYAVPWQTFQREIENWQLKPGADGVRQVFVTFKDEVGNQSKVVSDLINIDRRRPIGLGLEINDGEVFFNRQDRRIKVKFLSRDADFFMLSQDSAFVDSRWQPFVPQTAWVLKGEEGLKHLYVKYKDNNDNETEVYADSVIFDVTAPTGSVKINGGKSSTSHYNKIVSLDIKAEKDAYLMMIGNSSDFENAEWQRTRKRIEKWQLKGEENEIKYVYILFKDRAGNISRTFSDRIILRKERKR